MKRWVAWLAVVGLFLVGIVIGAVGSQIYQARPTAPPWAARGGRDHPPRHLRFLHRLERRLDLTDEQSRRIAAVLEESRSEGAAIRREVAPRVEAQMRRARERIEEILTPAQREEFHRMVRRNRRMAERSLLGP